MRFSRTIGSCIINEMSIQEYLKKFKPFRDFLIHADTILVFIIIGTASASFLLGRGSSVREQIPCVVNSVLSTTTPNVVIDTPVSSTTQNVSIIGAKSEVQHTQYVASKSGTKYHLLWCAGAKQIKEENKIFFNSTEEAKNAGYAPASNCKGI